MMQVDITVNGERIGTIHIHQSRDGITSFSTDPDSVNTYRWYYTRDGRHEATSRLTHRYGDGAITLVHKVLGEIAQRHQLAAQAGEPGC